LTQRVAKIFNSVDARQTADAQQGAAAGGNHSNG
jgi:hypothetical protein